MLDTGSTGSNDGIENTVTVYGVIRFFYIVPVCYEVHMCMKIIIWEVYYSFLQPLQIIMDLKANYFRFDQSYKNCIFIKLIPISHKNNLLSCLVYQRHMIQEIGNSHSS